MNRRDIRKQSKKARTSTNKVICQRSGFEIPASKAVVDHKGRITTKENYDPVHYTEMQIRYPIDEGVPYTRMEPTDRFVPEVTVPDTLTWDEVQYKWSELAKKWREEIT